MTDYSPNRNPAQHHGNSDARYSYSEILIGLLGAHSIATIHGERNQHTCHNRKIKCETPNER